MSNRVFSRVQHHWLISILLIAVMTRALIPAGFMPSTERPFSFEICPDGFPAQLLQDPDRHAAHHHHAHGGTAPAESQHPGNGSHDHAARAEHCVFAAAAATGPAPHAALLLTPIESAVVPHLYRSPSAPALARYRVQQPRGPPALS
ncbi:MAG TPA: hypothetical protein VG994_02245 [Steroidobacteraceae bacterium]|nr:hypothetical protein [Steroidobacteraceae bacterium]